MIRDNLLRSVVFLPTPPSVDERIHCDADFGHIAAGLPGPRQMWVAPTGSLQRMRRYENDARGTPMPGSTWVGPEAEGAMSTSKMAVGR